LWASVATKGICGQVKENTNHAFVYKLFKLMILFDSN
jgi:hypothetical protein